MYLTRASPSSSVARMHKTNSIRACVIVSLGFFIRHYAIIALPPYIPVFKIVESNLQLFACSLNYKAGTSGKMCFAHSKQYLALSLFLHKDSVNAIRQQASS